MAARDVYNPIGVDSITFACYDTGFWQRILSRFGFEHVSPQGRGRALMAHGGVVAALIDPSHPQHGEQVRQFITEHGDMQVLAVAIRVDDAERARREISAALECSPLERTEDGRGAARTFALTGTPGTVRWEIVEREGRASVASGDSWKARAVDHFAIAVFDLDRWERLYHDLGFETIYVPGEEIAGGHSAMKTVAVQRGGWTVALVEGVDRDMPSQVSTYARSHGDHAIQHAAIRFDDLRATLHELLALGVQFRLRRLRDPSAPLQLDDIMHAGKDHSGPLLQCFTKPLARRPDPRDPSAELAGFFFELIQRIPSEKKAAPGEQAFHDPTVIGLYRSIENEELEGDTELVFRDIGDYRFREWLAAAPAVR